MRRKLSNGISNYEELVDENRIYVDKTMFIEKLENLEDKRIMFLRPRKFGKTLFTSTLECYYDISKKDKFDTLFKNTYIGQNPSPLKNSYHILRFNFSGITTNTVDDTLKGFREKVDLGIERFINDYGIDFYINPELSTEGLLGNIFESFRVQKPKQKIYVIIDEYDHFANELLGFQTDEFKNLVAKNGKIRKWYEILKEGTESVVDRIFITGVAPITLDSTTSGFNIASDITKNIEFNDMLGFCKNDVIYLMNELDIDTKTQEYLLPIIKNNYDGYLFSVEMEDSFDNYKMYNTNMTIFFLKEYIRLSRIPRSLVDVNILSDYRKIEAFMNLCNTIGKTDLLQKLVSGKLIDSELTEKFNSDIHFGEKELISLLYYLGYITIKEEILGTLKFGIPNEVIKQVYSNYFLEYLRRTADFFEQLETNQMAREILLEGKIDTAIETLGKFLKSLSNRDFVKFDEKYVKVIFYSICQTLGAVNVKSELEIDGKYLDILITPIEKAEERFGILLEFKYIKKEDYEKDNTLLRQKQDEAKSQLETYRQTEDLKRIPNLKCYSVVAVKDDLFVDEV